MKPTYLRGLFTLVCLFAPLSVSASAEKAGTLAVTMPTNVLINQQFQVVVELKPSRSDFNGTVMVQARQIYKVKYEPNVFDLKVGEKKSITVTVLESESGLGDIAFFADDWEPAEGAVIVAGVITRIDAGLKEPIKSGNLQTFFVKLIDRNGNAVKLEANARLEFQGSNVSLYSDKGREWVDNINAGWEGGEAISIPIKLKGDWWTSDTGALRIQLRTQGAPVREESFNIQILPPWYVPLSVAVGGGLFYSVFQFLRRVLGSKRKAAWRVRLKAFSKALLLGVGAGLLAYLLANRGDILGIKKDTSGLGGLFLLGLLFSYVGADFILKMLSTKKA